MEVGGGDELAEVSRRGSLSARWGRTTSSRHPATSPSRIDVGKLDFSPHRTSGGDRGDVVSNPDSWLKN